MHRGIGLNEMIVVVHQPEFLPWLGFFDKLDKCDLFVLLDHVQFEKGYIQNRNRIKTAKGWEWITVPVAHKSTQAINKVEIVNENGWMRKHINTLIGNYNKSPFFKTKYVDFFKHVYAREWEMLIDLDLYLIRDIMKMLEINTPIIKSSDLYLRKNARKTDTLIDICKAVNADVYLSGIGGKNYMDIKKFEIEKIKVAYQDFKHPIYRQLFGKFEPYMSVIDLLFNCGDKSINIIRGKN